MSKCSDTEACEISLPVVDSFSLLSRVHSTSGRETGSVFSCLIQKSRTCAQLKSGASQFFGLHFYPFVAEAQRPVLLFSIFRAVKSKKQEARTGIV